MLFPFSASASRNGVRNAEVSSASSSRPVFSGSVAAWGSLSLALSLVLASCAGKPKGDKNLRATAKVQGFTDQSLNGELRFSEVPQVGLRIHGKIKGLVAGRTYAMHVHQNGDCSDPKASGDHFDPGSSGRHAGPGQSPGSGHAGDLPNIKANEEGVGAVDFTTNALGVGTSTFSVIGRSVILHANPDDYNTQPAGAAGERIGCGVIQPVK